MTPAARIAAVIEILCSFQSDRKQLETILSHWFRNHRFAGSKDRRAIRETTFAVSRICGRASKAIGSDDPRLLVAAFLADSADYTLDQLTDLFGSTPYAPPHLNSSERQALEAFYVSGTAIGGSIWDEIPPWLRPMCAESMIPDVEHELAALLERAPVDLRVNEDKATRDEMLSVFEGLGHECSPTPFSPLGIRLSEHVPLVGCEPYESGAVEVQDEASQIAALMVGARPGETVVDYCAGAGGKSLALAARMSGKGTVFAFDVSARRLAPLAKRAKRAGAGNIRPLVLSTDEAISAICALKGKADRVLVDAPCSGSGTWRRSPDARCLLTRDKLHEYQAQQLDIVNKSVELLKPGGLLIYVTCSLLISENETLIERVLGSNSQMNYLDSAQTWREITGGDRPDGVATKYGGIRLSPYRTATDGFCIHLLVSKE